MARVLLLHPNKWGRGITAIWIASHAAVLRARGHTVRLFDCTFFRDWTENENAFNTENRQYLPTDYDSVIQWSSAAVNKELRRTIGEFEPDLIFWGAISSHIHGEGEYVSIQYGHELLEGIESPALKICGGLQPTADPVGTFARFPDLDLMIRGESEFVLAELADAHPGIKMETVRGLSYRDPNGDIVVNPPQPIISRMDDIPPYDYSLFDDQVFLRPYSGRVVRAVDYELSRGCVFTCSYCVETVIQRYYGFLDQTHRGVLKNSRSYVRTKSAGRVHEEIRTLVRNHGIELIRSQDTNFLSIPRTVLEELAFLMDEDELPVRLYIETRPEGINSRTVDLLKRLQVDGVGMGIELSTQSFREKELNRFADQGKIIRSFDLLRRAGIKRTAYNIIGLPGQTEELIVETIDFNRKLDPDNITVAYYSPFAGTQLESKGIEQDYFLEYERDLDPQLRSVSRHDRMTSGLLDFYKENFVKIAREPSTDIDDLKS